MLQLMVIMERWEMQMILLLVKKVSLPMIIQTIIHQ